MSRKPQFVASADGTQLTRKLMSQLVVYHPCHARKAPLQKFPDRIYNGERQLVSTRLLVRIGNPHSHRCDRQPRQTRFDGATETFKALLTYTSAYGLCLGYAPETFTKQLRLREFRCRADHRVQPDDKG